MNKMKNQLKNSLFLNKDYVFYWSKIRIDKRSVNHDCNHVFSGQSVYIAMIFKM